MPEVYLPVPEEGKDTNATVQNLFDAYYRMRKELEYLLQHLDEDNVLRAQTAVISDLLAGKITANQIDVSQGKITTGQIEDLVVGNNVTMGPNARISWLNVDNQPYIPDDTHIGEVSLNKINATYIDAYGVWTPSVYAENMVGTYIYGKTIIGGLITSNSQINVTTDATIGNNLYMNPTHLGGINWAGCGTISGYAGGLHVDGPMSFYDNITMQNSAGISTSGPIYAGQFWMGGNYVATQNWTNSQGFLTQSLADNRYSLLGHSHSQYCTAQLFGGYIEFWQGGSYIGRCLAAA